MSKMNKAIDEVRAAEAKRLERDGYEPVLKHSRCCLLKRKENLTEKQAVKLSELLQYNLQSVRSRLMREDFQRFWEYCYPTCAAKFLDEWCTRTMRSKIGPMKKVALAKVKDDLSRYLRVAEGEEVVITRHGRPAGVLIGFETEEDWIEYRLEHHPDFLRRVARARGALQRGRGVRLEDVPA